MKTKVKNSKNKRNYLIIALIVIMLLLGVGYASFTDTLTMTGTITGSATWDVHFTNDSDGTVSQDGKTLTVNVANLSYPGDQVERTAVIENSGTMDAKLTALTPSGSLNTTDIEIDYIALPPSGENEIIAKNGGTCTYKIVIKWKEGSTAESISGNYSFTFDYEQYTPDAPDYEAEHSHS